MNLTSLFSKAMYLAETCNGSEQACHQFKTSAFVYEQAGGQPRNVDQLFDVAIRRAGNFVDEKELHKLLSRTNEVTPNDSVSRKDERPVVEIRKPKYQLTEAIVVAIARMYREKHPEKKWPTVHDGLIDPKIIFAVTGDAHWQAETWSALNQAGHQKCRGLTRSLSQILDAHCPERGKVQGPVLPVPRP